MRSAPGAGSEGVQGREAAAAPGSRNPCPPRCQQTASGKKIGGLLYVANCSRKYIFFFFRKNTGYHYKQGISFQIKKKKKLYVRVFCHLAVREKLERKSNGEAGPRPGPAAALLGAAAAAAPAAARASGCCASGCGLRRKGSGTAQGAPVHNPLLTAEDPPSSCTARGHCTNIARSAWPSYVLKSLKATSFQ